MTRIYLFSFCIWKRDIRTKLSKKYKDKNLRIKIKQAFKFGNYGKINFKKAEIKFSESDSII